MAFYDDDFVLSLPVDYLDAGASIHKKFRDLLSDSEDVTTYDRAVARETYQLLNALALRNGEFFPTGTPSDDVIFSVVNAQLASFESKLAARASASTGQRFQALLGAGFHYEFSEADCDRIQLLVNELRALIPDSDGFSAEHKQRLLARLEKLQQEIHKRVSNLDSFWGLIGDAGVSAGKLGKDAKPLVDRIREIVEITWRAQASAEALPTSTKPALLRGGGEIEE